MEATDSRSSRVGWQGLLLVALLSTTDVSYGGGVGVTASESDLAEMSLEELTSVKIASVYGASKHEQKITEAPSSVSIVTADDIKKSGYRTLADVLNSVRGFYTTSDRAYNYVGLRGFSRPGDYGGRMLITVDGHRMNDPIYDSAAIGTEAMVDVDLIERVEVIRGPGSSLYGNNAFFGVINIITRRGRDFGGAEVSGSYASFNTETGRISYGNRFTNGVELAISGTLADSQGAENVFYPEFASLNGGRATHSEQSQFGNGFLSLSYGDFSLEGGYAKRNRALVNAAYGAVFNDPNNTILDERAFADLKYQHQFAGEWEISARGYFDHYRYAGVYPLPELAVQDPLYPGQITVNHDISNSESVGGELQVVKVLFDKHRVTAGTEYRHDLSLNQREYDEQPPVTWVNSRLTADTVGVYGQGEFSLLSNLILNAGARYDYFSSFGDTVNPRAALIYNPWTETTVKALYGQAFRAPNAFELYYQAPGYTANTSLQPESIRSYEVALEQGLGSHLRLTSSLFYNDIKDLITFADDGSGTNSVFKNLNGATAKGGEMELGATSASGWQARLSYTYTDARDAASDQRLSNSPEHLAKLNLTAPIWRDQLFGNFELLGMSSRQTDRATTVRGFWVANATLFSRELLKGLEMSASVYNLFNQGYGDPVGADFVQTQMPQDRRMFRFKVTYRF